jgi:hypothetical protein
MSGGDQPSPEKTLTKSREEQEREVASTSGSTTTGTQAGTTTQAGTQAVDIPEWMLPGVQAAFGAYGGNIEDVQNLINQWQNVGFTPDQLAGFQAAREGVTGPGYQAGEDLLNRTIAGDFLYGGEGFNAAVEAAQRQAMPGVLSAFGLRGGTGTGGLAQTALARAFADPFAAQYGQERLAQERALQALPQYSMLPSQVLRDIGLQQQQQQQRGFDIPIQLQQSLFDPLRGVAGFAQPFLGGSTTATGTTTGQTTSETDAWSKLLEELESRARGKNLTYPSQYESSPLAGGLGGALAGAQIGSTFGPYGMAGGALLGGIGGAFA